MFASQLTDAFELSGGGWVDHVLVLDGSDEQPHDMVVLFWLDPYCANFHKRTHFEVPSQKPTFHLMFCDDRCVVIVI